jgi:hypothetical protein
MDLASKMVILFSDIGTVLGGSPPSDDTYDLMTEAGESLLTESGQNILVE